MSVPAPLLVDLPDIARAARRAAASAPPQPWQPIACVPKNGTLLDVLFDPVGADRAMAEFYAVGCTRPGAPNQPLIENVAFVNGSFKPVIDAAAARAVQALGGGWGCVDGLAYGIARVTLTHWRPAACPPI